MELVQRIKWGMFRAYVRIGSHVHVRHWRGAGIHSPFVYNLVRQVFMKNRLTGCQTGLYEELLANRVPEKQAVLLQNLFRHGKYNDYYILGNRGFKPAQNESSRIPILPEGKSLPGPRDDGQNISDQKGRNLCILLSGAKKQTVADAARSLYTTGGSLVILAPHRDRRTWQAARAVQRAYPCVSIDRRVMSLYFFDPKLHPQHFRI